MPASRPRRLSGIVWLQIVPRKTAEIMSAAPASAKKNTAIQIEVEKPASAMHPPYAAAASTMARPWWCTRLVQPEDAVATSAPMVSAE